MGIAIQRTLCALYFDITVLPFLRLIRINICNGIRLKEVTEMAEDRNIQKLNDEIMEDVSGGMMLIRKDLKAATFVSGTDQGISKAIHNNDTQADITLMGDMTRSVRDTSKVEKIKSGGIEKA